MKIFFDLFLIFSLAFLLAFGASAEETYKIGAVNAIRVLEHGLGINLGSRHGDIVSLAFGCSI